MGLRNTKIYVNVDVMLMKVVPYTEETIIFGGKVRVTVR